MQIQQVDAVQVARYLTSSSVSVGAGSNMRYYRLLGAPPRSLFSAALQRRGAHTVLNETCPTSVVCGESSASAFPGLDRDNSAKSASSVVATKSATAGTVAISLPVEALDR